MGDRKPDKHEVPNIIDCVKDTQLANAVAPLGEVALDSMLEDGTLKDLPLVGTAFKGLSVYTSVRDNLFARKLLRFLQHLSSVTKDERDGFVERMDREEKFRSRVGSNLLISLDKVDAVEKATLLAEAFRLYMVESIAYREFQILRAIVDAFNLAYIDETRMVFTYDLGDDTRQRDLLDHLVTCGIARASRIPGDEVLLHTSASVQYSKTLVGKLFVENVLPREPERIKSFFIETVLDLPETESIASEPDKCPKQFASCQSAREFLHELPPTYFEECMVRGSQFMDKEKKTRFRRVGPESYEFFDA